jgi:hypothetical protein
MKPNNTKLPFAIMASCLLTFVSAYSDDAQSTGAEGATQQIWEYKAIHRLGGAKQTQRDHLNELGRNGWELVLIDQAGRREYIFKRLVRKVDPDTASNQKLEVSISDEGFSIHGDLISLKELEGRLTGLPDEAQVLIQAEPAVSWGKVVPVIELCEKAGLRIVFVAAPKEEQADGGQPATRPESKSDGSDNPQPESEADSQ